MLEHSSSLKEEASGGDLDSDLLHVAEPHVEARVAGLAVNCQEVKVVVEAGEGGTYVVLLKVRACRGKEVGAALHTTGENISWEAHTDSGHLNCSEACLDHHVAPFVHAGLPLGEV